MAENTRMPFLAVIETQKVKSYLFASPIMRETRGASARMDWLNRMETMKLLQKDFGGEHETIYLGGGAGRVLFRDESKALQFKDKVIDLYREKTVNARVSVEVVARRQGEGFVDWMARGVRQSQRNKLGRIEGVAVLAGRWIMPCTSCGVEPAEHTLVEFGEHRLCRACNMKRKEIGGCLYSQIKPSEKEIPRCLKSPRELAKRYTADFIFATLGQAVQDKYGKKTVLPQTFEDIGKQSKPANYMGLIYADGNRMGETVKKLGKDFDGDEDIKRAYAAFSEIVDRATREAAVEAVLKNLDLREVESNEGPAMSVPAEFVLAGGDDLVLAVPAHIALETSIDFMTIYQEKTKALQARWVAEGKLPKPFDPDGLTTSAGVVIAHAHYPVSDLMTMAADLMKIAKEREAKLAKAASPKTGTVDFMVLSESGSEGVKDRRKAEYFSKEGPKPVEIWRTERPYTVSEARKLVGRIRAFKEAGIPRTKIKALYPAVFQSPLQAQFECLKILHRLKSTGCMGPDSAFFKFQDQFDHFPFRESGTDAQGTRWTSPITELVELYDYIQPAGKETENSQDKMASQAQETPETEGAHG